MSQSPTMKCIAFFCLLGLACSFTIERRDVINDASWQSWKSHHKKSYENIFDEKMRYAIWQDNLKKITDHNQYNRKMTLKMNHFGDLTNTEFRALMNGYRQSANKTGSTFLAPSNIKLPGSVDWRSEGYVTPIKNQGQCGSCWAFSTTGSLEGQHYKKTGTLVSLSEQQLVDCSSAYYNQGCHGGLMDNAFRYIKENNGIDTEDSYQYTAQDGYCHFNPSTVGATVSGYTDVARTENALQQAVATVGPISVAIDASHMSFQFYSTGVYDEPQCSSTQLDHGVLVVGYGSEDGQDYWLVKNSWGTSWGDEGYIKMTRNGNNQCGIASQASYPLV